MSRFSVFAFVEGKDVDPNFFARVCHSVCRPRGLECQVRTARELPGGAEGKQRLVSFYRYSSRRRTLRFTFNGKLRVLVFFLDKDVDDITRRRCRSKHVIYTEHYDVQNYLFRHGDFVNAVSAAASLDPNEISEHRIFTSGWCLSAARRWKEWIVLCLFSVLYADGRVVNYGSVSKVNSPANGALDQSRYNQQVLALRQASQLSQAQFERGVRKLTGKIEEHFARGNHDLVFKGKWYAKLLEDDLKDAFGNRGYFQNFRQKVVSALIISLDFRQPWADYLRTCVASVIGE